MKCSACGAANPQGKRFCADCGAAFPMTCPSCGGANLPNQKFCGDCGYTLKQAGAEPETRPEPVPSPSGDASLHAERRQLTVMFCDLVGSTALANRLDPEDMRAVLRRFHSVVASAVEPYDGYVAQLLGDGVLVYFGYPRAHEDDASRAVRAALAVLARVGTMQIPPSERGRTHVGTRIGIATGQVVVGEIGQGTPATERSASGETPNLAARLQAIAGPTAPN